MKLSQNLYDICQKQIEKSESFSGLEATVSKSSISIVPSTKQGLKRRKFLGENGARPSTLELERLIGENDLVDEFYLERALLAANPVVRVSIRHTSGHERGSATGVMISPRLLLTNEHVFPNKEEAVSSLVEFNYRDDVAGNPLPSFRYKLRPDLFFFSDPDLDFALVSVEPQSIQESRPISDFGYHRLIAESGKVNKGESLTIIQHPGGNRRQFAIRENKCTNDTNPLYIEYQSDTAQGSSGAPVFNDSFQIAALHRMGKAKKDGNMFILKDGQKVASLEDVDDSMVLWESNIGIRISKICESILKNAEEMNGHLEELRLAMEGGGDILSLAYAGKRSSEFEKNSIHEATTKDSYHIPIVLDLKVNFQGSSIAIPEIVKSPRQDLEAGGGELEAFKEPIIDKDYSSRQGFDRNFLGINTPLPKITPASIVAKMKNNKKEIPYEHFSIFLHRERRLAIFTASNVDGREASRKPEPGKDYTRASLGGLSKSDTEKWVLDERVSEAFQLPDIFYTKDRQSFDKGHIVRRDDVCFGSSYAQVQRANGDTYHSTNCSPQRKNFNQSKEGGLWGQLENIILGQAKTEKYSLFAGPVLSDSDPLFTGLDNQGKVKVKIPRHYWKVVCAVKDGTLQVFGFVLEQELSDVPMELEFEVPPTWKVHTRSLKEIETMLGYLKFDPVLHAADQKK